MGEILVPKPISFERKGQHEFTKPIAKVSKELNIIIDKLLAIASGDDVKAAERACSKLLDYHMSMVESKNKDDIARKLLSLKNGAPQNLEKEDNTPTIDFNNVIEIN